MADLVGSVEVDAPVAATWAAATDWGGHQHWMLGTHVTVSPGAPDHGLGAQLSARTGVGPVGFVDTMEITAWKPPHRCEVRHTGRVVRGSGAFEVEELPRGRSRFVWSERLVLPFGRAGEWGWLALRPIAAAGLSLSLRRFATWVPIRLPRGTS